MLASPDKRLAGRPARVHLVGGGVDTVGADSVLVPFVEEVCTHGQDRSARPRLALVMANDAGTAADFRPAYVESFDGLVDGGFDYVDLWLDTASSLTPAELDDVDGIVVAGGPTPVYLAGLAPLAHWLPKAIADDVPYLGFSAGAIVAARTALVGGWRDSGREVCNKDWSEGLDELRTEAGLALVDFTVDVHATQAGLLSRAISLARRDGIDRVVAIDESTCLSVPVAVQGTDSWQVTGTGFVWVIDAPDSHPPVVQRLSSD